MQHYSFAEVSYKHKIIRYLKSGKGTSYQQLLDLMRNTLRHLDPTRIMVIMHDEHHISAPLTQEDDDLLFEYYQSSEFVTECLIWTKEVYVAGKNHR